MELWCKDEIAQAKCAGKKRRVVGLTHQHLGRASVVEAIDVPEREALRLTTASGSILVNYALTTVLTE